MNKTLIIAMATIAMTFASCNTKPAEADLVILYTTDIHGACLGYDIKRDQPARTSLANVCTYVNKVREERPNQVLLFDTGDFLQGQPSIYYYNFVDTLAPHICALTYNYLKYDAIGVGNHDIEPGPAVYERLIPSQLDMPWLCANAIDQRTGKPMFHPYATFERQGIKIAVLGMITPHIGAWLPKALWENLEFEDMTECAAKWVPVIQEKEKPDLLIGLFHAGADYTVNDNDMDTPFNENGSVPAATKVAGFDLCLLGHDHNPTEFVAVNIAGDSVVFQDAGTQASKVGRTDIHFVLQEDGTYKKEIKTQLVNMQDYAPDSTFLATFQPAVDTVNAYVDQAIGNLTEPLKGIDGLLGPSTFIDFIHDAQLWAADAEVSFAAVLSPRDNVEAGAITMRHLFSIYKYENLLYTISMTADEIRQYLEYGYGMQFATMHSPHGHMMNFLPAEKGERPQLAGITFNFTSAGGIRYEVDLRQEVGKRVRLISMSDGSPIDPDKMYKVAINSYQYSGGGNFIPVGLGWDKEKLASRTICNSSKDVRSYIAQYIRTHKTIVPHLRGDWKILPEDWVKEAHERDLSILNGSNRFH